MNRRERDGDLRVIDESGEDTFFGGMFRARDFAARQGETLGRSLAERSLGANHCSQI